MPPTEEQSVQQPSTASDAPSGEKVASAPTNMAAVVSLVEEADASEQAALDSFFNAGLFGIENGPAFRLLQSMRDQNQLSAEKYELYKSKMMQLHGAVMGNIEYEKSLAKLVKDMQARQLSQKFEIERTTSRSYHDQSTIGELKRELLKSQNEVALCMSREAKLTHEAELVAAQKHEILNDIEQIRQHKIDMLEPQLVATNKELRLETLQRKQQIENLQKDLEEKRDNYQEILKWKDRLDVEKEKYTVALTKANELPIKIQKQSEVLKDAIHSLQVETVKQTILAQQLETDIIRVTKKRQDLEIEKQETQLTLEQRRIEVEALEAQSDEMFKNHELAKEQLTIQKAERIRLEMGTKRITHEIRREHDILLRSLRDKDNFYKGYIRLENLVNNIRNMMPAIQTQQDELKHQIDFQQKEQRAARASLKNARQEIDLGIYHFLQQENLEETQREALLQCQAKMSELEKELASCQNDQRQMAQQLHTVNIERDLRARDLTKIRNKHRHVKEDLRIKQAQIVDFHKRNGESMQRLRAFAALYEVIKSERNKYVNQIQATQQRASEMKEKLKILGNEIDILRHEYATKDRELHRKRHDNQMVYAIRDGLRNETNKLMHAYRERRDNIEQHLNQIESLNTVINATEQKMKLLQQQYASAVADRNGTGVMLLDRNDELCILYERLNQQTATAARGAFEMTAREDELRALSLAAQDLRRDLELLKKARPAMASDEKLLQDLEQELAQAQQRVQELSARLEDPNNPARCRHLPGTDAEETQLLERLRFLEERLAEKEERLLEKDLMLEEATKLSERLHAQTISHQQQAADQQHKVNRYQVRLKEVHSSMMATVSELSMMQAQRLLLQQQRDQQRQLLEEAQQRFESGQAPCEAFEVEFEKLSRQRDRARAAVMARRAAQEAGVDVEDVLYGTRTDDLIFETPAGWRTAAEPRPNAYVPSAETGDLPVPKPYGLHAPFKPQEPGASMRHYRKPRSRPIEI